MMHALLAWALASISSTWSERSTLLSREMKIVDWMEQGYHLGGS